MGILRELFAEALDHAGVHADVLLLPLLGLKGATAPPVQKGAGPHKFSSTQFNLEDAGYSRNQGSPVPKIRRMADAIADEDLASEGRETTSHVTIKYGLHTTDSGAVRRLVEGFGTVPIRLGKTTIFPAKETGSQRGGEQYDVVKIDVESERLRELNRLLSENLEHTDTHPRYQPHVTLAYVSPGTGQKYAGMDDVDGMAVLCTRLVFSEPDGKKTVIPLSSFGQQHKGWSAKDDEQHPRDDHGRFSSNQALPSTTTVPAYKDKWELIGEIGDLYHDRSKITPEAVRRIGEAMASMLTVDDLRRMKRTFHFDGGGVGKAALVQTIMERALGQSAALPGKKPSSAKPASKPKKQPAFEHPVDSREGLKDRVEHAVNVEHDSRSYADIVGGILAEHAKDVGSVRVHGMASAEPMRSMKISGIDYQWVGNPPPAAVGSSFYLLTAQAGTANDIPATLLGATSRIVFSNQPNKNDDLWRSSYKNFTESAATGGDGVVCIYNGKRINRDVFAHEAGHNLAEKLWGSSYPHPDSDYGRAQKTEGPVTEYAINGPAEDFAEACKLYAGDYSGGLFRDGKELLRTKFPLKYRALQAIFQKDSGHG